MDEVHCLGECARVFSDSNESVHFYISEHKSRAGGKEREQKKKKKQPYITMDRSLEQCNAASESFKIRGANNF